MTEQLTVEGNEVIGRLEEELQEIKDRAGWWEAAWVQSIEREKNLNKRLCITEPQADMEKLMRNILDEAEYEDDDENMRALRNHLWNDSDTAKKREAEEAVPF